MEKKFDLLVNIYEEGSKFTNIYPDCLSFVMMGLYIHITNLINNCGDDPEQLVKPREQILNELEQMSQEKFFTDNDYHLTAIMRLEVSARLSLRNGFEWFNYIRRQIERRHLRIYELKTQ
ncbi:MAG: hypothetical protein ABH832_01475 [bacterium]